MPELLSLFIVGINACQVFISQLEPKLSQHFHSRAAKVNSDGCTSVAQALTIVIPVTLHLRLWLLGPMPPCSPCLNQEYMAVDLCLWLRLRRCKLMILNAVISVPMVTTPLGPATHQKTTNRSAGKPEQRRKYNEIRGHAFEREQ